LTAIGRTCRKREGAHAAGAIFGLFAVRLLVNTVYNAMPSTHRAQPGIPRKGRLAISDSRRLAFEVLRRPPIRGCFVQESLHLALDRSGLPDRERRLATELVFGVIRRRRTLDALLADVVNRPFDRIQGDVLCALRLGAYQVVLLDTIPSYAAVAESVQLVRHIGLERATGFVNATLRALERNLAEGFDSGPGAAAVPVDEGRYRRMRRAVLPDPACDPLRYVAEAFSLPDWFVERRSAVADFRELCRLGFWFNARPSLYVRVNPLRLSRDELLARWQLAGVAAEPADHPQGVRLPEGARVSKLPGYREGWFTVQDLSAMGAAPLLAPRPGERVLDLCAAPGGKTTHLAEQMEDRGRVVACDVNLRRLEQVVKQCRRLKLRSVVAAVVDGASAHCPLRSEFDAVLVDAPCSNTGVLARRPEARWRVTPRDIAELSAVQRRLLRWGAECLKPGGRLLYVTCSFEPEENEQVIASALEQRRDLTLIAEEALVPGRPADGGYRALLARRGA
jgi:16S rRNA (cytosine967-C5)-methyltransferase